MPFSSSALRSLLLTVMVAACTPTAATPDQVEAARSKMPLDGSFASKLVHAALDRTKRVVVYTPDYVSLKYPGGDVPESTGVCTDEVIRAYRTLGYDLQKLVHEDMAANFSAYPKQWGLKTTDKNIDHRRVPNLETFFKRRGASLPVTKNASDYRPGDLITCLLDGRLPHIAMVVPSPTGEGAQWIVHNIGQGPQCEDRLFEFPLTGHYRWHPN